MPCAFGDWAWSEGSAYHRILTYHGDVVALPEQLESKTLQCFDDLADGCIHRKFRHQIGTPASAMNTSKIGGSIRNPHFDDGLPSDSETIGFLAQGMNHPGGEVHIHPSLFLVDSLGPSQVQVSRDVFPSFELFVEILSFHIILSLDRGIVSQR